MILVIDRSPESFWITSNAVGSIEELKLSHVDKIENAEDAITRELPQLVIFNADDPELNAIELVRKMRNKVFARHVPFLAITKSTDMTFRRELLIAGVSQIVYRKQGEDFDLVYLKNIILWILNSDEPSKDLFEYTPQPFTNKARMTLYGRIGWISETHTLIESYLELKPGEKVEINSPLFEEIGVSALGVCEKVNHVGRYYKYSSTMLLRLEFVNQKNRRLEEEIVDVTATMMVMKDDLTNHKKSQNDLKEKEKQAGDEKEKFATNELIKKVTSKEVSVRKGDSKGLYF